MTERDGKVLLVDIADEMKQSYIDYAMSVIVNRALPDVRDGLKPVHRRILYAMREAGNTPDRPFKKSARTVGDVLGKYHPHGDAAVYDALVRLAQEFAVRYPLIEGHGNFGSVDGDPPAAMRYCLTGDALVVTDQGLLRLDQISPGQSEGISIRVLSMGGRVNTASKWFDCGSFPVKRVATRYGFELTGTDNHPLLCWSPGAGGQPRLVWKTVAAVRPGDWLVLDRGADFWPADTVELADRHPVLPLGSRAERHALPLRLDEELAFLLGALVAEGTVRGTAIEFTHLPGTFAEAFRQTWERVFPTCRLHIFLREAVGYGRQPFYQMQVVSQQVIAFLGNLGLGGRSAERQVPEPVLRSPRPVVAAFLRALFEGDGAVERSGRSLLRVTLCSAGRQLLRQVQTLLLRFGIVAALRSDGRKGYRLLLTGQRNLTLFAREIGFVSEGKRSALRNALTAFSGRTLSKTDWIPFLTDFVRRHAPRGHREWLSKHNIDRPERLVAALPRLATALPGRELEWIGELAGGRYFFDQVVAVDDAGVQRVYSVRVDSPCHSFVANGFVNHNTEARLSPLAMELMRDLDKNTVDFSPNFDETEREPNVLPARFPHLLANGAAGIAVGMATNIPPHNLSELIDGLVALIDDPDLTVRDLMRYIRGPDFPTGALILGREGIREAYQRGRGSITIRADARIEEARGGKVRIVIGEIPYQVNKAKIIEQIAELVRERRIEGITDLRDETDRTGLRIVVELGRQANPNVVLNQLFKYTPLQQSYGIIMLALVDGEPKVLDLREMLQHYLDHQRDVIVRRSRFELERAEDRAHILEGLRIALDHIDEVVALIRGSRTVEEARQGLMGRFGLSEKQAQAILDMRLQRLTGLEREKVDEEYHGLLKEIEYLRAVLASEKMVAGIIRRELLEIKDRFGDARRTRIVSAPDGAEFSPEDLIAEEDVVITLTRQGYIKRMPLSVYRSQRRGGRGVTGVQTREEDLAAQLLLATTHHQLLFFTDRGRVYRRVVHEVPEASRQARGTAVINVIEVERGERVRAVVPVREFAPGSYLVMATRRGVVKRTELSEFEHIRRTGLIAITLEDEDDLVGVRLTSGRDEIMLVTRRGMSVRFAEDGVRSMGRAARGVHGVHLGRDDAVVGMEVVDQQADVLVVTEKGFGKRTPVREYRLQSRGGKGIKTLTITAKNGPVVGFRMVRPGDEVLLVSSGGVLIRVPVDEIPVHGRAAQGVVLMRLDEGDRVVALEHVDREEHA